MHYEAVIFDLDGTLVEFKFRVSAAKRAIFGELKRIGLNLPGQPLAATTQSIFDEVELQVKKGMTNIPYVEIRRRLEEILDVYEVESFANTRLRQDANFILTFLKNQGVKLGLVTNDGSEATHYALTRFNLAGYFSAIVTRDGVKRLKPGPDGIFKALDVLKTPACRVIFIGDSSIDIMAAKEAGVKVAAITGGAQSLDRLRESSPNYIIQSLADISKLIS